MPSLRTTSAGVLAAGLVLVVVASSGPERDALAGGSRLERIVNQHRPSRQEAATLAVAQDGTVHIAWQSRHQDGAASSVHLRRFAPDGRTLGSEQRCLGDAQQPAFDPAVAADGTVAATVFAGPATGQDVRVGAWQAGADARGEQSSSVLATNDAGTWVAWLDQQPKDPHPHARLQQHGAPATTATQIDDIAEETLRGLTLAAHGAHLVAVWTAIGADGLPRGIRARRFDAQGRALGASQLLIAGAGAIEPAVAAQAHGLALAWMDNGGAREHYDVRAQRFAWTLEPQTPALLVAAAAGHVQSGARIALAIDGEIACAWNRGEAGHAGRDVWLQRMQADGTPRAPAAVAHVQVEGDQALAPTPHRTALAYLPQGGLAVVWSGTIDGGRGEDVGLTLLLPAGVTPATVADDQIAPATGDDARPSVQHVAEAAVPHDPPVRTGPASTLPNGGDLNPTGMNDPGFLGITFQGLTPPDPHVAAGPDHIAGIVNGGLAFWRKNGAQTFFQKIDGTAGFWAAVGGTGFVFDPEILFDTHSDRFFAMACERYQNTTSHFLLAVSDDSDPNGVWFKYRFNVTTEGGGSDIDSPNLAIDKDAVYLSADFFTGGQKYLVYMVAKQPLLSGQTPPPPTHVLFRGSQSYGMPAIHGTAPAMYVIEHFESSSNSVVGLRAITNPLTTPVVTPPLTQGPLTLSVPTYQRPTSVPQQGTSTRFTTFDSRFWSCVWRNGSLWACHHHGSSQVQARWYEFRTNTWPQSGTVSLRQSGDVNPGIGIHTFFNSISVDAYGNALMCFARSASNEFVSIGRAFRRASDPLGTMQPMDIVKANTFTYTSNRWGDYSGVAVDPTDQATFWYHHEYAGTGNTWNTWVAWRRVQDPALSCDVSTLSAPAGGVAKFTLDNPIRPGDTYLLLATLSGTSPGFLLPGPPAYIRMPLNPDALTTLVLSGLGNPVFTGFLGTLDANGRANAQLNCPPVPFLQGQTAHFAWLHLTPRIDFASNAVEIRFVP